MEYQEHPVQISHKAFNPASIKRSLAKMKKLSGGTDLKSKIAEQSDHPIDLEQFAVIPTICQIPVKKVMKPSIVDIIK